ncbi:hypothetical protein K2173_025827 [Erythroxylum novogranatense]|uniref:Uncharacterized protein n=1 Tax=Erythroxylum novogranatense TaxID=1862640 RepID=A0AAV8SHG9_9ROSI|nr:hypothetical protein K2173_025827 [Erythroxylum novogranatense]
MHLAMLSHVRVGKGRTVRALRGRSLCPLQLNQQGETARVGGSRFNVLENVEALSEDLSQSGLQSHSFVFSDCGRKVAQSVVVQSEPNGIQPGPIPTEGPQNPSGPLPTEGPTNVAIAQDQNPGSVHGPTGLASVDRATSRGQGQLNPALIQLQPSVPDNHLAIELQSHTEMVCDQGLLIGQPLDKSEVSPLMEGLEASGGGRVWERGPPPQLLRPNNFTIGGSTFGRLTNPATGCGDGPGPTGC